MRRPAGSLEGTQEVAGFPVDDELGVQHHPQLAPVEGRHGPLGPERPRHRPGHESNIYSICVVTSTRDSRGTSPSSRSFYVPQRVKARGDNKVVAQLMRSNSHRAPGLDMEPDAGLPCREGRPERVVALWKAGVPPRGNSQGDPSGNARSTWACWARTASAALEDRGTSCSAFIFQLLKRRQGQPELSVLR